MYSELNTVSESWLKIMTNNKEEAISNNTQHKGLGEYQEIMTRSFREYHRILKPSAWMTVEFSNTSASFWNSLQYSIKNAGFIISAITDLNKERGGLHAMLGPTAVKQDLAISCYKPTIEFEEKVKSNPSESLWDFVYQYLSHASNFVPQNGKSLFITERDPRIIYDRVISYYVQYGLEIPINSVEFQKGLDERFIKLDGMYFSAEDAAEYERKVIETDGLATLALIVTNEGEGIHWLQNELRDHPQTYSELQPKWMQSLGGTKKGDIVPELMDILDENFIKNDDGTWRLVNENDDVDKEKRRTKSLLKEFKIYLETVKRPRGKLPRVRVEAVRAGFKQCYSDKNFADIILVGDRIPQSLLTEDEVLLQYYDIASSKV